MIMLDGVFVFIVELQILRILNISLEAGLDAQVQPYLL